MKKIKFIFATIVLSVVMCFCLSACRDNNNQKTEQLTTENVYKYLAFSVTVSNCLAEYIETDSLNNRIYDLSCVLTISTTRAADCNFSSPTRIKYDSLVLADVIGIDTNWKLPKNIVGQYIELGAQVGYDGTSAVSFSIKKTGSYGLDFPTISTIDNSFGLYLTSNPKLISSVSGVVIIH